MAERLSPTITVDAHKAVIAVPTATEGTVYFVEEDTEPLPEEVQDALNLAGAWRDLDWQETEQALERIRRQSTPTPPIDEL
jgi:hypothetical protein